MVSIIIVNYKSSRDIDTCLASIIEHERQYKKYEIIIVDNNSGDQNLPGLKKKYPFVTIIDAPKNGGFAYGNNIGIRAASHDIIFLLNPDTFIKANSIEKLYNRLSGDPGLDLIGPLLRYPDGRNQSYYLPKTYLTLWKMFCSEFNIYRLFPRSRVINSYYRTYMDYEKETYVEQISGAALMFKKRILDKTGLMDENYFLYFEESDFCLQAVKNGFRLLYYPGSTVFHVGGYEKSSWQENIGITSLKYYFRKNFNVMAPYAAVLIHRLGESVRSILASPKKS